MDLALKLISNLLTYASIGLPVYLIYYYLNKKHKFDDPDFRRSILGHLAIIFYKGRDSTLLPTIDADVNTVTRKKERSAWSAAIVLLFCFCGLQLAYVTWGVLQEKIMTQEYTSSDGKQVKFSDSQFLVLINRLTAFLLASAYICCSRHQSQPVPLCQYSFASLSNILSSWCQYEALKYVSFPTQIVSKACKVVPVMLMGKLVGGKSYSCHQYVTAVLISVGVATFLLHGSNSKATSDRTTISGAFLLLAYLGTDSFTSNWQDKIFTRYKCSSMQMMCAVNFWSTTFTLVSIIEHGSINTNVQFFLSAPAAIFDAFVLSLCSAIGQLFIFFTISEFGAVTFTIIMTIRMVLSIFLSSIIFNHYLGPGQLLGVIITFVAVFARAYLNFHYRKK